MVLTLRYFAAMLGLGGIIFCVMALYLLWTSRR
jgi:hypothetical protein